MKKQYQLKQIMPGITLLYGFKEECCIYAVEGDEKIALIDNGMGTGDLHEALERICPGKEVIAINTHGHFDHCAGNHQFEKVYMHALSYADLDETEAMTCPREVVYDDLPCYDYDRVPVSEGFVFDLGGKALEVIETPGHTPGCISLLDREDRVIFCGDLIGTDGHCVHMLDHLEFVSFSTVSIETYLRSLRTVESIADSFDGILGGHDDHPLGKDLLAELIRMSEGILAGTAKRYHPDLPPNYGKTVCWRVDGKDTAILYQDEVIFDK